MRGLAEYVMLGRRQAVIITLLCGFFPLLTLFSAATVALVTLRKGSSEGLLLLLWAMLPAGTFWALGDVSPAFICSGAFVVALALRQTQSWQMALLLATGVGLLAQLSLVFQQDYVTQVQSVIGNGLGGRLNETSDTQYSTQELVDLLFSFYGAYHGLMVVVSVMIGRVWQAMLYNPGGFKQEFHNLRIDPRVMALLVAVILAGLLDIPPFDGWMPLLCLIPMFAGLAYTHYVVAVKKMGTVILVLCYVALLFMPPVIILLGMADSVVDLRKRMQKGKND